MIATAFLVMPAGATTSGTTACWLEVQSTVPADGAVVPPDGVFTAIVDEWVGGCDGEVVLELRDTSGGLVPSTVTIERGADGLLLYRLVPSLPLPVGTTYTFRASGPDEAGSPPHEANVVVGELPPFPEESPAATFSFEGHDCDSSFLVLGVRVESGLPLSGLLRTRYSVDARVFETLTPADRETVLESGTGSPAGLQACATATFEDLTGRVVWTMPEACSPEVQCPTYGPPTSVTFDAYALCDARDPLTAIDVRVDLPRAAPNAEGSLDVFAGPDSSALRWQLSTMTSGPDWDPEFGLRIPGWHGGCFELRMSDRAMEEEWRSGPYCSRELDFCPQLEESDFRGAVATPPAGPAGHPAGSPGTCGSLPGSSPASVAPPLVLWLTRRRARAVARTPPST